MCAPSAVGLYVMVIALPAKPSAEVAEVEDSPNNAALVPLNVRVISCVKLIPFTVIVCVFVPFGMAVKLSVPALGEVRVGSVVRSQGTPCPVNWLN